MPLKAVALALKRLNLLNALWTLCSSANGEEARTFTAFYSSVTV